MEPGKRFRRGGRANRAGRFRRAARAAGQGLNRALGGGEVREETVGDVIREAGRAVRNRFRRNRG